MYKYIFLKQEKPEMDDFEKYLEKFQYFKKKFFTDTLAKMSQNIFAYSFVSENSVPFFIF